MVRSKNQNKYLKKKRKTRKKISKQKLRRKNSKNKVGGRGFRNFFKSRKKNNKKNNKKKNAIASSPLGFSNPRFLSNKNRQEIRRRGLPDLNISITERSLPNIPITETPLPDIPITETPLPDNPNSIYNTSPEPEYEDPGPLRMTNEPEYEDPGPLIISNEPGYDVPTPLRMTNTEPTYLTLNQLKNRYQGNPKNLYAVPSYQNTSESNIQSFQFNKGNDIPFSKPLSQSVVTPSLNEPNEPNDPNEPLYGIGTRTTTYF